MDNNIGSISISQIALGKKENKKMGTVKVNLILVSPMFRILTEAFLLNPGSCYLLRINKNQREKVL